MNWLVGFIFGFLIGGFLGLLLGVMVSATRKKVLEEQVDHWQRMYEIAISHDGPKEGA